MYLLPVLLLTSIFSIVGVETAEPQCDKSQFDCGIDDGKPLCIPLAWACDGEPDCGDSRDEQDCTDASTCAPSEFKCRSAGNTRPCIPKMWRCDGESDCHDGSDESYCEATKEMPLSSSDRTTGIHNTMAIPSSADTMTTGTPAISSDQTTTSLPNPTDIPTPDVTKTAYPSTKPSGGLTKILGPTSMENFSSSGTTEASIKTSHEIVTIISPTYTANSSNIETTRTSPEAGDLTTPNLYESTITYNILGTAQVTSTDSGIHTSNGGQSTFMPTSEATTKPLTVLTPSTEGSSTVLSTTAACQKSEFKCSDEQCLPLNFRCDGEVDCKDRSDEYNCDATVCEDGQFRCQSGACIPGYWECDTVEDCTDGTDESNCQGHLGTIQPLVSITTAKTTRTSIVTSVVTAIATGDQTVSTKQSTTTAGSNTTTTTNNVTFDQTTTSPIPVCDEAEFQCGDGHCLPVTFRCDQDNDCSDGSDEYGCDTVPCDNNGFKCRYGSCIPGHWECDTVEDCFDGSDESDCNGHMGSIQTLGPRTTRVPVITTTTTEVSGPLHTTVNQEMSTELQTTGQVTDVVSPMTDNVTIANNQSTTPSTTISTSSIIQCDDADFRCQNGHCLVVTFLCDGNDDCGDSSDEQSCDSFKCKASQFQCESGSCIPGYWECDTVEDCFDGSDESHCNGRMGTIRPLVPMASRAPLVIKRIASSGVVDQTAHSSSQASAAWSVEKSNASKRCMDLLGQGTCEFLKADCHGATVSRKCRRTCGVCGTSEQEQSDDYNMPIKHNFKYLTP